MKIKFSNEVLMSFNRSRRQAEATLGDNNCAFNSFILGLAQEYVLGEINPRFELDQDFIKEAAYALQVEANWRDISAEIMRLRNVDKYQLQKKLQGSMRALAIRLGTAEEQYKLASENHLLAAYGLFASGEALPRMQQDDIFARHQFIIDKFRKVQHADELREWWRQDGFDAFQAAMSCDGAWAGAQEIGLLAHYFNVNLQVERHGVVIEGFNNNGLLDTSAIPQDFVRELGLRNIIEQEHLTNHTQKFNVSSLEEIEKRVNEFDDREIVLPYIAKDQDVPADWARERISELVDRGVISQDGKRFIVSPEAANERMCPMPDVTRFMAVVKRDLKPAPTIFLQNNNAAHWNNMPANFKPAVVEPTLLDDLTASLSKVRFDERKFRGLVRDAKRENSQEVEYSLNGQLFFVSREKQIQLDEQLAKKIQAEEYQACRK